MTRPSVGASAWARCGLAVVGGLLGGVAGAAVAVLVTNVIKELLAIVSRQDAWVLIVAPLTGLALSALVLHGYGRGSAVQALVPEPRKRRLRIAPSWWTFHTDVARADLTADVLATAGSEERFPWRLAPIRAVAIIATVGLGAPMGTESPAGHLGVAAGSWLGQSWRRLRRITRPAAVGGGAAGVAALMGIPLVGTAFILELGRRSNAPLSAERVIAALVGGLVGWWINVGFDLELIRLVVPDAAPGSLLLVLGTALLVGASSGAITAVTGVAIYRARGWQAAARVRLAIGGAAVAGALLAIAAIARPTAAIGPGSAAVVWAEIADVSLPVLLAVALLRAAATVGAVAAGGCGGFFVPFLAVGDLSGRMFAPVLGVTGSLAGAAGAAGGIAGGYRLPVTATAMVLGVGGPFPAVLTCLLAIAVATVVGTAVVVAIDRLMSRRAAASPDES